MNSKSPMGTKHDVAPVEAGLAERIDTFTTCGCGDDDWPLMRHDIQRHFESQSAEIARKDAQLSAMVDLWIADRFTLTAAIEGQSYWQARAERVQKALSAGRKALATAVIAHSGGLFDHSSVGEHVVIKEMDAALQEPQP